MSKKADRVINEALVVPVTGSGYTPTKHTWITNFIDKEGTAPTWSEGLPPLPAGLTHQWDATDAAQFTLSGSDVVDWTDGIGGVTLVLAQSGTSPTRDNDDRVTFYSKQRGLGNVSLPFDYRGVDHSIFVCGQMNSVVDTAAQSFFQGPHYFDRCEYTTAGGGQVRNFSSAGLSDLAQDRYGESLLDQVIAAGISKTNQVSTTYDLDSYLASKTKVTAAGLTLNAGLTTQLWVGSANTSTVTVMDGFIHEVLLFDVALDESEAGQVMDYFAAKYGARIS